MSALNWIGRNMIGAKQLGRSSHQFKLYRVSGAGGSSMNVDKDSHHQAFDKLWISE